MARQTLPTSHRAQTTALVDEPSAETVGTPHFSARGAAPTGHPARTSRLPSRAYVMVVISLAVFVVGLTFWCHPDIRHEVVGQVRIVSQQGAVLPDEKTRQESTNQLQQILSQSDTWSKACRELGIETGQSARPSFNFRAPSEPANGLPAVVVTLDESRPELAIRLVNRYLQEIVERFEHLQLGGVDPAVLTAAQSQVDSARADRDRVQAEFDQLTARLTTLPSEPEGTTPPNSSASADSTQTAGTESTSTTQAEPESTDATSPLASGGGDSEGESAELLASRRRLEAQLAEASRSLDAAVDLQRELQQRTTAGSGLHLVISHPGRLAARRASPLRVEQLSWLAIPSILCGLLAALAVPARPRGATLRTIEQVEAISPFPVIVMRRDAAQAGPGLPHHMRRHRRQAPWLHGLVRVSEITVMLAIMVVVSYGWTASGYTQRLMENPFAAYTEAAAITLGQWHAF